MFKINSEPKFEAALTIVGQGREQTLNLTCKHKDKSEYQALLQSIRDGKTTPADAVLQLVEKWDADAELNADSINRLAEQQPGADWAILEGYWHALVVARKGN